MRLGRLTHLPNLPSLTAKKRRVNSALRRVGANWGSGMEPAVATTIEAAHDEGRILSAEPETCRDGRPHWYFAGNVGYAVQIALGVGMGVIDGGRK